MEVGVASSITGSSVTRAGGGGGGGFIGCGGAGGSGGGGRGGNSNTDARSCGTANTGGGGGGAGDEPGQPSVNGSAGGSGVVVVKELSKASGVWSMQSQYQLQSQGTWASTIPNFICATGGTITESGDYRIHTFTAFRKFSYMHSANTR